jgi:PAS domain S-box-containing protein
MRGSRPPRPLSPEPLAEPGTGWPTSADSTFTLADGSQSVPLARRFVTSALTEAGLDGLVSDAAVVVTELCSNAVLHAPEAPAMLRIAVTPGPKLRIEVEDANPMPPVPLRALAIGTTGRGLSLVIQLCDAWGVDHRRDGTVGKIVWAEQTVPTDDEPEDAIELDLEALLAQWPDLEPAPDAEADSLGFRIDDIPVELFLESDQHLESLLRELYLAGIDDGRTTHRLRPGLVESMNAALRAAEKPRRTLLRAAMDAAAHGRDRFSVRMPPPAPGPVGTGLIEILAEADQRARDARLLTLETPARYRAFRRWLWERSQAEIMSQKTGAPPQRPQTFEEFLLDELTRTDDRLRSTALAATLHEVTAELAATQDAEVIADVAVGQGCQTLGATGGVLIVINGDQGVRFLGARGNDTELFAHFVALQGNEHGPGRAAGLSGQPVYLESPTERDERFPGLGDVQPQTSALAVLPLMVAGEPIGLLRFSFDRPHLFDQDERSYLLSLAGQVALAFARVHVLDDLERAWDQLDALMQDSSAPVTRRLPDEATRQLSAVDLELLRVLYRDAPIGIAVFNAAGRYLRLNKALASMHHGTWSEQIGMTVEQALGPEEGRVLRGRIEQVVASGKALLHDDFWLVDVHGVWHCWRTSWFPIRDAAKRVDSVLAVAVEVTDGPRPR